tara:strand:- start:10 stop:390 length:381 start_codon:yes stop_codon:yes gene_type:complete
MMKQKALPRTGAGLSPQMQPVSGSRHKPQRFTLLPRAMNGFLVFSSSRARSAMIELMCGADGNEGSLKVVEALVMLAERDYSLICQVSRVSRGIVYANKSNAQADVKLSGAYRGAMASVPVWACTY